MTSMKSSEMKKTIQDTKLEMEAIKKTQTEENLAKKLCHLIFLDT